MALIATPGEKQERKLPPAGPQVARLIRVIDLGKQKTQFKNEDGSDKVQHKVRIDWELPLKKAVFKAEKGEEPFVIGADYTVSMNEKANLRKDVEAWLGKTLSEKEVGSFDLASLLGTTGLLTVTHNSEGDKTYANVGSLMPLMEGMTCPPCICGLVKYEIEEGNSATFKALPEWLRKRIESAINWEGQPF